jgi:uncharacterized protein YndB with AHSA1/START domain
MSAPIVVEREVAAAPSVVYSYLTESSKWARWQGVDATIQARAGGLFAVTMPNGTRARGQFIELELNRRIVFSWGWIDHEGLPPGSSTVEIELTPLEGGTLVRLTHSGLPPEEVELHTAGWDRYLPRLGLAAEGGQPEPDILPT